MATYQICLLGSPGAITLARKFLCDDDNDALALAQKMMKGRGKGTQGEVWLCTRLVGRVTAEAIFPNSG